MGIFMKQIKLTQGQFALVDDEDYDFINSFKWYAHKAKRKYRDVYYAWRNSTNEKGRTTVQMHSIIIGEVPTGMDIDHVDGNGLNNQRINLRFATRSQNGGNQLSWGKTSKFKGVCFHKRDKIYVAQIRKDNKHMHIGYFENEIDAAKAYDKRALELNGEFARINFK